MRERVQMVSGDLEIGRRARRYLALDHSRFDLSSRKEFCAPGCSSVARVCPEKNQAIEFERIKVFNQRFRLFIKIIRLPPTPSRQAGCKR